MTTLTNAKRKRKFAWHLQALDYGLALPALARLPLRWGRFLARVRGQINARHGRDWVELSQDLRYVGERTAKAFATLWPHLNTQQLVVQRYQQVACEEWHAMLIRNDRLTDLHLDLSALKTLLSQRNPDRGLVVLTAHFDSVMIGTLGLGLCGVTTNVTTSHVYDNPLVHALVRQFFDKKYHAGERYLNGGRFMHVETSSRAFFKALMRQEVVVVVADTPASERGPGLWIPWIGAQRKLNDGALRMALRTNSEMCAMVCITADDGSLHWLCSKVYDPQTDADSAAKCFAHLQTAILDHPGHWWAAHLVENYPVRNDTNG